MPYVNYDIYGRPTLNLTPEDIEAIARVAYAEASGFARYGQEQLAGGLGGVVDTILNRIAAGQFNDDPEADTAVEVVDSPGEFEPVLDTAGNTWAELPPAPRSGFSRSNSR
jgi:hypothetical protein